VLAKTFYIVAIFETFDIQTVFDNYEVCSQKAWNTVCRSQLQLLRRCITHGPVRTLFSTVRYVNTHTHRVIPNKTHYIETACSAPNIKPVKSRITFSQQLFFSDMATGATTPY
jgi:hypothetical protein